MLARIENNAIVELRRDITLEAVPPHKRAVWREVPEKPAIDPRHTVITELLVTGEGIAWGTEARPVEAVRIEQIARIEDAAEVRRQALSAERSGKRDAYLLKSELAVKAEMGDEGAIALIAAEAAARGINEPALRALILDKRKRWTEAAMAIEATEAATKRAILAATDGPGAVAAADAGAEALERIA